jgi:sugar lactone lactonase YvrE
MIRFLCIVTSSLFVAACGRAEQAAVELAPQLVATVSGFDIPESVRYDPARDVFYVSNVTGNPQTKDNNGFISRVRADGTVDSLRFIAGGTNGVTLHSPKGMFLSGDTLWVADIDALRSFDVTSGAPLQSVELAPNGAVFLNDVTRRRDGTFFISDTRIAFGDSGVTHRGGDRVYQVAPDGRITIAVESDTLGWPNGVFWDEEGGRLLIAAVGARRIFEWRDSTLRLIAEGPGGYDGVESLGGGRFLISAQDDSSISVLENGRLAKLISGIVSPGDIGWDAAQRRVFIPMLDANQVQIWKLP